MTWQDIEAIVNIADDYANEIVINEKDWPGRKEYYQEILKRYVEWKEQKQSKRYGK